MHVDLKQNSRHRNIKNMDANDEEITSGYTRTKEDLKSMIIHAKLEESNFTNIPRSFYYPALSDDAADLKLLELDSHLLQELEAGK
jgi:sister chromatid cohesion protein DCC1